MFFLKNNELLSIIKHAISNADRGLFFVADYEKQALNVLKELDKAGFKVVPKNPSDNMVNAGRECISYGITNPKELVKQIYEKMTDVI
ncbi:MAG: hypothetical protein J0H68_06820 [Sphingobacteriia bacterium]|nr:hypothetical protein [Sphingobacteriia bacterium]